MQIFLDELYDRGVENPGAKVDPGEAAQLMRTAITEEGKKRFTSKQYKDKEQIESYWSRRTAQIKYKRSKESKVSDEDVHLVEEDVALNDRKKLRLQVLESCEQNEKELPDFHPLETNGIKFCLMAGDLIQKGTTGHLKIERYTLAQISVALEERGLEIPQHRGTKRRFCEIIKGFVEKTCPDHCLSLIEGAKIGTIEDFEDNEES